MSKDLLKTATAKISSAAFNSIVFNNDDIEKTIRPELVTRTELHPVEVNGKIEDRIYYTLHNDAGDCVYVSEFLRMVPESEDKVETLIPGSPISGSVSAPPNYPTPPTPPDYIIPGGQDDNNDEDDNTIKPWPEIVKPEEDIVIGPGYIPGGGGVVVDDDTDEPSGLFKPRKPRTNFDNYASLLVNNGWFGYTPNVDFEQNTRNVYKFYEVTYSATSAVAAMKETRTAKRQLGLDEIHPMPKLRNAEEMFMGAAIKTFNAKYPSMSNAKGMFNGCKILETVNFKDKGAVALTEASDMFANCEALRKANLGNTFRLNESEYTFYNCKSLKSVDMALNNLSSGTGFFYNCSSLTTLSSNARFLDALSTGDYMFYGCSSLKVTPKISNNLTSAKGMFWGCSNLTFSDWPALYNLQIGRGMFNGCNITHVDLNFPALEDGTQMFINCDIRSIGPTINFRNLKYGNGFLGSAKLDLTTALRVLSEVSKLGPMEEKNGNVNNGIHIGVCPDLPGENTELTWEKFLESIPWDAELGVVQYDNGWQVVLNQNSI